MTNNFGGRREGAGHPPGVPSPGSGRKPSAIKLRIGDKLLVHRRTPDGLSLASEMWTIVMVSRVEITLSAANGDTVWLRK